MKENQKKDQLSKDTRIDSKLKKDSTNKETKKTVSEPSKKTSTINDLNHTDKKKTN